MSKELLAWLMLFKAETVEDLEKLEALEIPEINEAIKAYWDTVESEEFKELVRLRAEASSNETLAT